MENARFMTKRAWDRAERGHTALIPFCQKAANLFFRKRLCVERLSKEELGAAARDYSERLQKAKEWMDSSHLGAELAGRFGPKKVVLVTNTYGYDPLPGYVSNYYLGTNCIAIEHEKDKQYDGEWATARIVAELHRLAAYLGGGLRIRWRDDEWRMVERTPPTHWSGRAKYDWFQSSVTMMLTQRLLQAHQVKLCPRGYEIDLLNVMLMQEVAGEEIMKKAYFSGDYTKVRDLLNARLGEGTFEETLAILDGEGSRRDSSIKLIEKMKAAGINLKEFCYDALFLELLPSIKSPYPGVIESLPIPPQ